MKSRLITKYYELRQQRQCAAIMERNWEALGLLIQMRHIAQYSMRDISMMYY